MSKIRSFLLVCISMSFGLSAGGADSPKVCGKIVKFETSSFCANGCTNGVSATLDSGQVIHVQESVGLNLLTSLISGGLTTCFDEYGYVVSASK
jgi:hypothetical protein